VLSRVFLAAEGDPAPLTEKGLRELAQAALPTGRAWPWHQALMDLGATVCTDARPACLVCPLQDVCRAAFRAGRIVREAQTTYEVKVRRKEGPWRGSTRYYRGRIVAALGALPHGERLTLPALAARIAPEQAATTAANGARMGGRPDGRRVADGATEGDGAGGDTPASHMADSELAWLRDLVTRLAADGLVAIHTTDDGQIDVALPE
jgi:hypothetical protein